MFQSQNLRPGVGEYMGKKEMPQGPPFPARICAYATQLGEQKLSRNDLSFKGGTYTHWAFKARFPLTKFQGRRIKKKKREREKKKLRVWYALLLFNKPGLIYSLQEF